MKPSELIGAAGATSLRQRLDTTSDDDGVARFLLDRLSGEQVAAIAAALLKDPATDALLKIAIPRALVADFDLPEHVLTDERTTHVRNAECDRPALLMANADDDQGASLHDVTLVGAKQLTEDPRPWVEAASAGLGLLEGQIAAWIAALRGLNEADDWTLHQIAHYVALTRSCIEEQSTPVAAALGWALPALHLPRDRGYFLGLTDKDSDQPRRWKKLFEKLVSDRKPLLNKQRANRQIIESEELRSQFEQVREDIAPHAYEVIEAFIEAAPGWGDEAEALATFEWESDSILQLFSGLKQKKTRLPEETINFFEFEFPDRLSDADLQYLAQLKARTLLISAES